MKVVLFIDNHSMDKVDISELSKGNPGIGGTQYEMFLLAYLMFIRNKDIDFHLVLTHKQNGFDFPNIHVIDRFDDVFSFCEVNKVDVAIMRENNRYNLIKGLTKTKVIFWVHNFISYPVVRQIGLEDNIKRVIFVSKQHYDFYIEYNLNKKANYIFNTLAFPQSLPKQVEKQNNVVFTGNIVPIKRLHLVTKIWPYIHKKVPDSKLLVIGTGANAHRDVELGPHKLATAEYESKIFKPLEKHNLIDTVEFLGIKGIDKNEIIQTAKVGVSPNKDETFCLSAAEYIINGVPVVGVSRGGINDVVLHKQTGLLHRSLGSIKKDIVRILKGKKNIVISQESIKAMESKFSYDCFYDAWIQNIQEVYEGVKVKRLRPSKPYWDKAKWVGCVFRFLRRYFKLPERFTRLGVYSLIRRSK